MIYDSPYFDLEELVCPHVYKKFHETAWQFFDSRLIMTINKLREKIGKPIFVNNWRDKGEFDQRGFRCIQCDLVKDAISENRLYVSPHMTGQGADFDVEGLLAEEVRQWIIKHPFFVPYPIRLEEAVNWVHIDVRDGYNEKIHLFK